MKRFFIYFKILRPKLLIPSLVSTFIGFIFALDIHSFSLSTLFYFFLGLLITGPFIGGGALVLNQYFDYEEDKQTAKRRKYPLLRYRINRKKAFFHAVYLLFIGVLVALLVNIEVFIITLIAATLSVIYSAPPIRLKKRPFLDSITNGICYGILPTSVGFSIASPISFDSLIISLPLFLGYTAGHMLLAIPDIENDRKFNLRTTAVVLGYKNTVTVAMGLFLTMFVLLGLYSLIGIIPTTTFIFIFPIGVYILKEHFELLKGVKIIEKIYARLSLEFFDFIFF